MNSTRPGRWCPPLLRWAGLLLVGTGAMVSGFAQTTAPTVTATAVRAEFTAELIERGGQVQVSLTAGTWTNAPSGVLLRPGHSLRTGPDSRATLRLSDLSLVRLRENTVIEIREPTRAAGQRNLFLRSGALFFLNRQGPSEVEFETPLANGAIRGTEFLLQVGSQQETLLALFDGAVDLQTPTESLQLVPGQQVELQTGQPARISPALPARLLIQWVFYYPAVLNPADLTWADGEQLRFGASLRAYRAGNLREALVQLPEPLPADSAGAIVYRAGLKLAVGSVEAARELLAPLPSETPGRRALQELIATVTQAPESSDGPSPRKASDWLAETYRLQSLFQLRSARDAAHKATELAPDLGFAWVRLAELEFSLGRRDAAREALKRAREVSPELATAFSLEGYIALARDRSREAGSWFDEALQRDGSLAPAWLGRGLARAGQRDFAGAQRDTQVAAVLEPQRGVFRSYLGKAFAQTGEDRLADKDFRLAKELDPADPTAWFYAALHDQQLNRNNSAVRNLERSVELNDNRAVFRSRWLLDQDLAIRNADLAVIYGAAGLLEAGEQAAVLSVGDDYANYSAHLFLSRSLAAQSDPNRYDLRFETPRESELLVANLLAPPGGGNLSRWVSQQVHLAYFVPRRFGFSTYTEYESGGNFEQNASFYGREEGLSYALDVQYLNFAGQQPNGTLEQLGISVQMQQRLTDDDSLYVSLSGLDDERGDVAAYYNPEDANRRLKVTERQEPNIFTGYHHQWSEQSHTLALVGYLRNKLDLTDARPGMYFLRESGGQIVSITSEPFVEVDLESTFNLVSGEVQQIWSTGPHQVVGGVRVQGGQVESATQLDRTLTGRLADDSVSVSFGRVSGYGYYQWDPVDWFRFNAGLSYDYLQYPENADLPPLSEADQSESQWSPKVALTFFPWQGGQLRGAYARSLGGLYFDDSVRLEPTQLAGFTQAFRSLIPESVVGLVPGTSFDTAGVGYNQVLKSGTYFGVEAVRLTSEGDRQVGALTNGQPLPIPDTLITLDQTLDFEERTVALYANQLLGQSWTIGARGSVSEARLETAYPGLPVGTPGLDQLNTDQSAVLSMVELSLLYQHPSGWFAQWFSNYYHQSNDGYEPALPGDSFWQQNVFIGYRWPRQRAEIRAGILNLTDQDYRLNPLNLLNEPRRERTFVISLQLNL
ncbi:MAG: FecR domain-containing protein [Verrucomicrobia bacterium]|nr:FecR domain-containing protein [Verrucomicrobiota bacterium]